MITREEYELLIGYRAIGYKWIARDKSKMLYVYNYKPFKGNRVWDTIGEETSYSYILNSCRADIFKSITWEDEKPTSIADLINDYKSHQEITGGNNVNKAELVKEIEEIIDDIGVSDYQLGECDEDTIWTISSITIREILSAIKKYSPVSVGEKVKVTIPSFVADWINGVRVVLGESSMFDAYDDLKRDIWDNPRLSEEHRKMVIKIYRWICDNHDTFIDAWRNGYVVEKEKLYTVELPNHQRLAKIDDDIKFYDEREWFEKNLNTKLTLAEIESVDPILMGCAVEVE